MDEQSYKNLVEALTLIGFVRCNKDGRVPRSLLHKEPETYKKIPRHFNPARELLNARAARAHIPTNRVSRVPKRPEYMMVEAKDKNDLPYTIAILPRTGEVLFLADAIGLDSEYGHLDFINVTPRE